MHTIKNIKRGKGGRRCFIYATLHDMSDDHMEISAGLDYIIQAVKERKYQVVLDGETLETIANIISEAEQCGP